MKSTQYPFEIPCPHDTDPSISSDVMLPNYHPLSREDIVNLLNFAKDHGGDGGALSKVMVRLSQGIPGMTYPHSIDDDVSEKSARLDQVFVNWCLSGFATDIVEELELLMRE